jgi:hypothetical protein
MNDPVLPFGFPPTYLVVGLLILAIWGFKYLHEWFKGRRPPDDRG